MSQKILEFWLDLTDPFDTVIFSQSCLGHLTSTTSPARSLHFSFGRWAMEKTTVSCPHCGQRLAFIIGEIGTRRRIKTAARVELRMNKNALGEPLGWLTCPSCKRDHRFDAALWPGP